eukprot:GHVQ01023052.1.p1 GENE.GHVQ01023052.1~~GHVQ01023052.1.p1  ORF type:complete len:692 (+),score=78.62 GHVQ01023052.1:150-2078(+)
MENFPFDAFPSATPSATFGMSPSGTSRSSLGLDWKDVFIKRIRKRNRLESDCFKELYKAYKDIINENKRLLLSAATSAAAVAFGTLEEREEFRRRITFGSPATSLLPQVEAEGSDAGRLSELQRELAKERDRAVETELLLRSIIDDKIRLLSDKTTECEALIKIVRDREEEVAEKEQEVCSLSSSCDLLLREQLDLKQQLERARTELVEKSLENEQILASLLRFKQSEAQRLNDLQALYVSIINSDEKPLSIPCSPATTQAQVTSETGAEVSVPSVIHSQQPCGQEQDVSELGPRRSDTSLPGLGATASGVVPVCSTIPVARRHPRSLGRSLKPHCGSVNAIATIKLGDGTTATVSGGLDGHLVFLDILKPSVMYSFPVGRNNPVRCIDTAASPSDFLLISTDDWSLSSINCRTQRVSQTLKGHTRRVTGCGYIESGDNDTSLTAYSVSHDRTLRLWDLRTAGCVRTQHCYSGIMGSSVSPNKRVIATAHQNGTVAIWRISEGQFEPLCKPRQIHDNMVTGVSFSPDGRYLLSQSKDHTIKVLDVTEVKVLATLQAEEYRTERDVVPRFSEDGLLITTFAGSSLWSWELSCCVEAARQTGGVVTGRHLVEDSGKPEPITCLCYSSGLAVTGHQDGSVLLWET